MLRAAGAAFFDAVHFAWVNAQTGIGLHAMRSRNALASLIVANSRSTGSPHSHTVQSANGTLRITVPMKSRRLPQMRYRLRPFHSRIASWSSSYCVLRSRHVLVKSKDVRDVVPVSGHLRSPVTRLQVRAKVTGDTVSYVPAFQGCGFALADQGADTRLIQDYLGHKNIQHTVQYTASNPARFQKLWR